MSGYAEGENSNYEAKIHKKARKTIEDLAQEGTARRWLRLAHYLLTIRRIPEITVQPVKLTMLFASMCSGAGQTVNNTDMSLKTTTNAVPVIYNLV